MQVVNKQKKGSKVNRSKKENPHILSSMIGFQDMTKFQAFK